MARALAAEGARLAILARNEPELDAARTELDLHSRLVRVRELEGATTCRTPVEWSVLAAC